MEPITIHVEVNLGEKTIGILQNLLQSNTNSAAAPAAPSSQPADTAQESAPAGNQPEAKTNQPEPISDEELRAAVKSAKDATSAADVKAIFAEFGIKTSSECPDEHRHGLMEKLVELTKAS